MPRPRTRLDIRAAPALRPGAYEALVERPGDPREVVSLHAAGLAFEYGVASAVVPLGL